MDKLKNLRVDQTKKPSTKKMNRKISERRKRIFAIVFLSILSLIQLFPFYLKLVDSFQSIELIPEYGRLYLWPVNAEGKLSFDFSNYLLAIEKGGLLKAFVNSMIHTVTFTFLSLVVAIVLGYVLGKMKFRGKRFITALLLSTYIVPGQILMVPNYLLVLRLGWNLSLLGIILPGIVNVFGVFLIKQYMSNIPDEVLESAEIDGCGEIKKIFKIVIPMSRPIIITYVILTFVGAWNEYLWPLILYQNPNLFTLQLTMYQFYPQFGGYADGFVRSAGMILITIPIIIMYILAQKYFLEQANISGIK